MSNIDIQIKRIKKEINIIDEKIKQIKNGLYLPENEIIFGDCLQVMSLLPDSSIDLILCDLPYGITACKWDKIIPLELLWQQYKRLIKPGKPIVLMASQPFTTALITSNMKWFKYCWVWDKGIVTGGTTAKYRPLKAHEDICIFSDGICFYNPQLVQFTEEEIKRSRKNPYIATSGAVTNFTKNIVPGRRELLARGGKYPKSIIKIGAVHSCSKEKKEGKHPTQKPVKLFSYLINTYSQAGDLVLDNCIGSGTTALAAIENKRNFIGIENNKEYYDIATKRIQTKLHI